MLTADDFISRIPEFGDLSPKLQSDLLALYLMKEAGVVVTSASIASLRNALHLPEYARISTYLSEQIKTNRGKKGRYVKLKSGYALERSYADALSSQYLGRPATKYLASSLRSTVSATSDPSVKAYLEEAIACFESGLLRSSLIMSWCVAYGLFRSWIFRNHLAQFNSVSALWKTPVSISVLDDFQELTESVVLDTARKAKLVSKEQLKVLKGLLDQRNSFAHPTSRSITPSMAEAYIEVVVKDVIPTFG